MGVQEEVELGENFRVLARKGMGAESSKQQSLVKRQITTNQKRWINAQVK